ncbi:MAG: ornithine carbamoyltransferase [Desulfobacterales bacterium]|nr:ornithine carbamoyltransferase [Desulfobacterales bacterium]
MSKDYIDIQDYSKEELETLLELIVPMKAGYKARELPALLDRRTLSMVFLGSSLRTRMSFEVAMNALGGNGLYIRPGDLHLGVKETLKDTAIVMGSMCDGIVCRSPQYSDIAGLAKDAKVSVINGMADDCNHPTQALCDVFTMYEKSGKIKGLNLAFVGDTSKGFGVIGRDLMLMASKLGFNFYCASPKEYMVDDEYRKMIMDNASKSGAEIVITEDPKEVVKNADFLTCDAITWYGFEDEEEDRFRILMPYQVNKELFDLTPSHCQFMHCLPAKRGEEVTAEVIDGPRSIVFDQAENRLHAELSLCAAFLGDEKDIKNVEESGNLSENTKQIITILRKWYAMQN